MTHFLKIFIAATALLMTTSCQKDTKYSELIIGNWIHTELNGKDVSTNDIFVLSFSKDKIILSRGYNIDDSHKEWAENEESTYSLKNGHIIFRSVNKFGTVNDIDFKIRKITKEKLEITVHYMAINGNKVLDYSTYTMSKGNSNHKKEILGLWEGRNVTPGVSADSKEGELHRWEYFADGSYKYYSKNELGVWVEKVDNQGKYFLYGEYLTSNWTNDYVSNKVGTAFECWEIDISDNSTTMNWEGRRSSSKKVYFSMKKISQ